MGSTTWDYFTPHHADAGEALRRLRRQVFRDGRYERFAPSPQDLEVLQGKPRRIDPGVPPAERDFTVYRDGKPHELFFIGTSGD